MPNEAQRRKSIRMSIIIPKRHQKNAELFPEYLYEVVALFKRDCKDKLTDVYIDSDRLFISGHNGRVRCELMLRIPPQGDTLVISRIRFIHKRIGNMTELQAILKRIGLEIGFKEIQIESVQTPEMRQYCEKHHYVPDHSKRNYTLKII